MNIHKQISKKYCPRFGQIAVEMGYINEDQLKEALCSQVDDDISGRGHRIIGTILFENGWMESEQIETVLTHLLQEMRTEEETPSS